MIAILGLSAALFQALGYLLYIRLFARRVIRPNAASQFMFAYGTALLVLLEWGDNATWHVLALPATCAAMSVLVALMCLRKHATEPVDRIEAITFSADIWLTIFWVAIAFGYGDIAPYSAAFLVAGNITTLTSFLPVLRSTWNNPEREQPMPWIVWTIAYALLGVATIAADRGQNPALLLYPLLSVTLHGSVALMAFRRKPRADSWVDAERTIYIAQSGIHGQGMFAGRRFEPGEALCTLSGRAIFGAVTEDGPNYIGLGPDVWIDPVKPLDHVNHHCRPNAAFGPRRRLRALRLIHPGEEVTIDYSTTECDENWWMRCGCSAPDCRKVLFAIQRSFADQEEPPVASPLMQLVWRKRHDAFRAEARERAAGRHGLGDVPAPARITPLRWLPGGRRNPSRGKEPVRPQAVASRKV